MKKIMIVIVSMFLFACGPQAPESQLNATISEMLILIDKGKSQELLAKYAYFSNSSGSISDISEDRLKQLRFALLRAKELKPLLTENSSKGTYDDPALPRPLIFIKVNEKWLLKN